uniref:Uncharacterized protein n=1 Tax=Arundo donax TaxID=35708 RepID=A0A0A9H510_ARUDO
MYVRIFDKKGNDLSVSEIGIALKVFFQTELLFLKLV